MYTWAQKAVPRTLPIKLFMFYNNNFVLSLQVRMDYNTDYFKQCKLFCSSKPQLQNVNNAECKMYEQICLTFLLNTGFVNQAPTQAVLQSLDLTDKQSNMIIYYSMINSKEETNTQILKAKPLPKPWYILYYLLMPPLLLTSSYLIPRLSQIQTFQDAPTLVYEHSQQILYHSVLNA